MWPIDPFPNYNFWQTIFILLVPILIDLPRTIGKSILLLGQEAYAHLKKAEVQRESFPFVSVIVPAHNEGEAIEKSIRCLLESDYSRKEVVVVDDGSTDTTYGIAKSFSRKGLIKLVRRETASGKKARAVNLGLRLAKGDIILILDADTRVEAKSLSNMVKCFSNPAVGAVAGNVRVGNEKNLLTRLQVYEYMIAMEMGRRYHKNIFFKSKFGMAGLLGAPDMVFADMILIFIRFGWIGFMLVANPTWLGQILVLTFAFYLALELLQGAVAGTLSPRKGDLLYMIYVPILVLIYRPLLSFVRLKAYLDGLKSATGKW